MHIISGLGLIICGFIYVKLDAYSKRFYLLFSWVGLTLVVLSKI